MLVRPFQEGDDENIARIHNLGFREWIDSLSFHYGYSYLKPDDIKKWKSKDGLFVAEIDGEPVGFVHSGAWDVVGVTIGGILTHKGDGEYGQGKIVVIPEKRRMGVGSELVRAALNHIRERKGTLADVRVYSDNTPARNLFRKLGFVHHKDVFNHPIISKRNRDYFADIRSAVFDLAQPVPKVEMNREVEVREATKDDVEKLLDYAEATGNIGYFRGSSKEHILDWINGQETAMVAELKGRIVGCIDAEKTTGHLGVPGVLPEFRRKGIGSALLYNVLRVLKARGYARAMTDSEVINEPAWRLYRKLGFNEERRVEAWVKPLRKISNIIYLLKACGKQYPKRGKCSDLLSLL